MSAILRTAGKLITSKNFAKVPEVQTWGLDELKPDAHSGEGSSASSANSTKRNIDREEPCFVTKSSCYTHERAHWVNAVRDDPRLKQEIEELLRDKLRIVYANFSLDGIVNLTNLDRVLHAALDRYAFFAITGSLDTLKQLISKLEVDNQRRQEVFNAKGVDYGRMFDVSPVVYLSGPDLRSLCFHEQFEDPAFANPQYELVALRPKHMLPNGKVLVAYSQDANVVAHKTYVPGPDHTLREFPGDLACPRFPPFFFDYPRQKGANLNPFLVILNAEIKFRRYRRQLQPPPLLLPTDVMTLMNLTCNLVELVYWIPVLQPNTNAAEIFLHTDPVPVHEYEPMSEPSDTEMGYLDDGVKRDIPTLKAHGRGIRRQAGGTLQERIEHYQHLLLGRDLPFNDDDEDLLRELDQACHFTEIDLACQVEKVQLWRIAVQG